MPFLFYFFRILTQKISAIVGVGARILKNTVNLKEHNSN